MILSTTSTRDEIFTEWTRRLREDGIPQGPSYLGMDDKRCCLGVLSDMAVEAGVTTVTTAIGGLRSYGDSAATTHPPLEVQQWAGLGNPAGHYGDGCYLTNANDSGKTFAEIADIIDAHRDVLAGA